MELSPAEQLSEIERRTTDDGLIECELDSYEKRGNQVDVGFITPTGDVRSETMYWPTAATDSEKFVRVAKLTGFGLNAFDEACEMGTEILVDPESMTIHAPAPKSYKQRLIERTEDFSWAEGFVGFFLAPASFFLIFALFDRNMNTGVRGWVLGSVGTLLWLFIIGVLISV